MHRDGWSFERIGKWIGRAPSTVRRLLKRAALEQQRSPGFVWPVDSRGRQICDIAHPMPRTGETAQDPRKWVHARLSQRKRNTRPILVGGERPPVRVGFCPVCRCGGLLERPVFFTGQPLADVLVEKQVNKQFVDKSK